MLAPTDYTQKHKGGGGGITTKEAHTLGRSRSARGARATEVHTLKGEIRMRGGERIRRSSHAGGASFAFT